MDEVMDAIIVLLGLVIGVAIFLFVMNQITAIVYNCSSVAITFFICWIIGIILAWIAWKIALIVGGIALVLYLVSKFKKKGKQDHGNNSDTSSSETNSEND